MLTPDEKFNIIKQSLKDGYRGSISNLIDPDALIEEGLVLNTKSPLAVI